MEETPKRILIVDDDSTFAKEALAALRKKGEDVGVIEDTPLKRISAPAPREPRVRSDQEKHKKKKARGKTQARRSKRGF